MTRSLVGEIKTLSDVYNSDNKNQINYITDIYKKNFDFVINSIEEEPFQKKFLREDLVLWIDL